VRVPCGSFDEVFRTTSAGAADFGVVPIENSTEGGVARALDLFLHTPLFIIGETSLFVRHNLLRKDRLDRRHQPCWRIRRRWRNATNG
jgi:chorismate mutase/prephenate dehydratase